MRLIFPIAGTGITIERIHLNFFTLLVVPLLLSSIQSIDIPSLSDTLQPRSLVEVVATKLDGTKQSFKALVRIDTPVEIDYYRNGGILPTVLRKLAEA